MSVEQTLKERGSRYGDFSVHAEICQDFMRVMKRARNQNAWPDLSDVQRQALTVIADKIARILSGDPDYADNWHDIQGYAKLVEERLPSAQHEQASRVAVAIDKLASHAGQAGQFKPSDLFKPDSNGEIGTVVEGGLRRQIYRDGKLVEDVIVPMPTQQGEDGRFFVDCSDCGAPDGDMHYVLCPRLPVPEAHAEAVEAAFAEQAQFDEARADIIGQNGNEGEHYEQPVDVNDWRTWQVGDVLECAVEVDAGDESTDKIAVGERCEVLEIEPPEYKGALPVKIQGVDYVGWPDFEDYAAAEGAPLLRLFRFHHRPAKTDE